MEETIHLFSIADCLETCTKNITFMTDQESGSDFPTQANIWKWNKLK